MVIPAGLMQMVLALMMSLAKLAYIDSVNFARLVTCPSAFGTGLGDPVVPPEAWAGLQCLDLQRDTLLSRICA